MRKSRRFNPIKFIFLVLWLISMGFIVNHYFSGQDELVIDTNKVISHTASQSKLFTSDKEDFIKTEDELEVAVVEMIMAWESEREFMIPTLSYDQAEKGIQAAIASMKDYPGYYSAVSSTESATSDVSLRLRVNYKISKVDFDASVKKAEAIVDDIIHEGMTSFDKTLAIHDYLVDHIAYTDNIEASHERIYTMYGALIHGDAVCQGYAEAFQYLSHLAGLETMIVQGTAGGEAHAWNLVKLDDDWYHVDVTWDDPVMPGGTQVKRYDYLNVTDEQISMDHQFQTEDYPVARGEGYNYYVYMDLYAENESDLIERLQVFFDGQGHQIELKTGYDIDHTYVEGVLSALERGSYRSLQYSVNPVHNTLNLSDVVYW
ncbi:transglutaminase domain-containing protein [Petrocella sp. FN5]|uniref:transglutaminase domain-containing protein n=1 Tax=Petrocella sp. FN5 TaxID=3032002 RepID=UPI0023DB449B|nr:transglutaminase domain-containing protein [Petrocella sp. FN5]MDF1618521.1 transglutaminase domain-containing protein [Petrocella sp. FN5]